MVTKIDPFAEAQKASKNSKASKKETNFALPVDMEQTLQDYVTACKNLEAAEAQKELAAGPLTQWATDQFINKFAAEARPPESCKIKGEHDTVSYVFQDRGGGSSFLEEAQVEMLSETLGEQIMDEIVVSRSEYSINPEILNIPGVAQGITKAIQGMVDKGVLTVEQSSQLLKSKDKRFIKKGVLDRLADLCDKDPKKIKQVVEAAGTTYTKYIKY